MASQKETLLSLLKRNSKGVTTPEAQRKGVNEPRKRVYDLREEGYRVYTNTRKTKTGKTEVYYRLG